MTPLDRERATPSRDSLREALEWLVAAHDGDGAYPCDCLAHQKARAALDSTATEGDRDDGIGLAPLDALRSIATHSGDPGSRWVAEKALGRATEGVAPSHRLLMPPHPGEVYGASALCSCGEWQFDAATPGDLTALYRAILRDHAAHVGDTRERKPSPEEDK